METLFAKKRKELKLTQRELADRLGVTETMLRYVEHRKTHFSAEKIYKYCQILGITTEDYFKEFYEKDPKGGWYANNERKVFKWSWYAFWKSF